MGRGLYISFKSLHWVVGTVSSIDAEEEEEAEHGKVFHDFSFKTSRVVT